MPCSASLARNASCSAGGAARRFQAVGLSPKIWSAVAPISAARSAALTIPLPSGRWAPRRRPSGSIRAIVAGTIWYGRTVTEPRDAGDAAAQRRLTELEKVVRAFLRDGRLVSIPAKPKKRDLLLPVILDRCFPEDRAYEEKEVNMRLALLHPDVAALRRYLVDGGLMTRDAGVYRRARPMEPA
jgi:hypothetical protein